MTSMQYEVLPMDPEWLREDPSLAGMTHWVRNNWSPNKVWNAVMGGTEQECIRFVAERQRPRIAA